MGIPAETVAEAAAGSGTRTCDAKDTRTVAPKSGTLAGAGAIKRTDADAGVGFETTVSVNPALPRIGRPPGFGAKASSYWFAPGVAVPYVSMFEFTAMPL